MNNPICVGCNTPGSHIDEYKYAAEDNGMDVEDYIREEEGTYNPQNGHFYCTDCYIKLGSPIGIAP